MIRPALFLDRDGVINVDHGYVHTKQNFHFIDGIFELVAAATQAGFIIVVVTNQAGIGRGYYSERQFHELTQWMISKFAEHGGKIHGVYFCPFHPEHGVGSYRRESEFRKPAPGMLLRAKSDLRIDMCRSILIGDKASDMDAGRAAGVGTLLHFCGEHGSHDTILIQTLSEASFYIRTNLS
jgi:D-glycero-D-manno-heptose 1,7-bisphosphate phosphatase